MIIEIPDDNSIIKWKYKDTDDWTTTEILDLINAYAERRPQGVWVADYDNYMCYCSKCEYRATFPHNFCPNCGAQMQKGGAEND